MTWQEVGIINPSRNWQFTENVEGEFFRLTHQHSDLPTEYFQAAVVQVEEHENGEISTAGYQVIEASENKEVIQLKKPECFGSRKIAIKQLSRDVDLPPVGKVYSWAIGIERWVTEEDGGEEEIPPARQTTKNKLTYAAIALQSYSYYSGTYTLEKISDGITGSGVMIEGSESLQVKITFDQPRIINEIRAFRGQFNGPYHSPNRMRVWITNNTADTLPILTAEGAGFNSYPQAVTIDTLENTAFGTARTEYYFTFDQTGTGSLSLNELELYGY